MILTGSSKNWLHGVDSQGRTNDLDYNIFSRLLHDLKPGYILVSSGAAEIGRIDYMKRNGTELKGDMEEIKIDYAAQGRPS